MANSLDDIAGAGFAFGADHRRPFGDATESLAKVTATADEGGGEGVFFHMVGMVGGCENFGFVDIVDPEGFKDLHTGESAVGFCFEDGLSGLGGCDYLAFDEVSYSCFGHDGDRDGFHDLFDHLWVGHTGYTALGSNVCGDTLEGHDGAGAGFFCYSCLTVVSEEPRRLREIGWAAYLFSIDNIHNHAPLQHLR